MEGMYTPPVTSRWYAPHVSPGEESSMVGGLSRSVVQFPAATTLMTSLEAA